MNIRVALKRIGLVYALNALFKAAQMKRALARLSVRYSTLCKGLEYKAEDIPDMVAERLKERGIFQSPRERLRIFWIGANWEQDNSGFLQALEKVGEVSHFTNFNGKYGLEFSEREYDQALVERNSNCLLEQITRVQETRGKIDLLLGQMWANYLSVEALKRIQDMGIATANISMDDRLPELWEVHNGVLLGSIGLAKGLDLVLTSSPECCIRYAYHGCPAIFWPMASDPKLFKPAEEKDLDVSFVGNNYGTRGTIVRMLQSEGIRIETYGAGWPNGPVGPREAAKIFGRSKIILGIGTIGYCSDLYTLKLRDFDATMAGALYITHRNPDLLNLFVEGEEIECYSTNDEALEKIKYYRGHPEQRERIGRAAAAKARKLHTWEGRIETALHEVGLVAM